MIIEGYTDLKISENINIQEDENDYDFLIYSDDTIILIKKYSSMKELEESWKNQIYFIGGYIQPNFAKLDIPEACLWNTYIAYIVDFDIDPALEIEIEIDKYVCKKYIVDSRGFETESQAIINRLPALTSLVLGNEMLQYIDDEKNIKSLFVDIQGVDERIKKFIIEDSDCVSKSIDIIINEMIEVLNE